MTAGMQLSASVEPVCYEEILSSIGDAVTVQDRAFRIVYQNPAMKLLFGDCVGSSCYSAYGNSPDVCPDCPVAACFDDGVVHSAERKLVVNGEARIFENTASPLRDKNGTMYAAVEVVRDISSRKRTEERLRCFRNMYAALSNTNKTIMESVSQEEMFDRICTAAVEFGKFSLAVIGLTDSDGVVRAVAHHGAASRYLDTLVVHADARTEEGRGPTGRAIREGIPYICNDFHSDPITTPWRVAALHHGISASAAFPLTFHGVVVGALKVYSDHAGFFTTEIVGLLTEMAANISFGLKNFSREEQRRQSEEALRKSEEQLKLVLEGSNDGYCDWHIPSATVWMSARYIEMLGYLPGEIDQTPLAIKRLVHPEDWPLADSFIDEELVSNHPSFELAVRMKAKSGEWKWVQYRGKVVERDGQGLATRVAGTCTDITEKKMFEERLKYAGTHDQLTGLYNRAYFDSEFERMKVGRSFPVSIVSADVDGLKAVNDRFGHVEGDRLLRLAARAMKESFRAEDVVARIGGDEFAVILPNADENVVKETVKRVLACQATLSTSLQHYQLSISIGSATADCSEQLNESLKQADARMYYYKYRRKSGLQND
jgi:diguanylate cyclase (GGDEF)-like protein/PAS domain S-box-containing protein